MHVDIHVTVLNVLILYSDPLEPFGLKFYHFCSSPLHLLPHVHHAPNAITGLHVPESLVDSVQRLAVGDELVNLELAIQVVLDETGKLGSALNTTESAALPHTTCNKLEC